MKTESIFSPVQAGRAGEDIALQIEAAIMSGKIIPGESLPSERELQAQFGTGRGVVREALRALKEKGLIEIRKGAKGGAFVKQVDVAHASEPLALFLKQHSIDPDHVAEFRESIDRTISILAISRGSRQEKENLVASAEAFRDAFNSPEPDMIALGEMDRQLNIDLARMTHNPVFEWIMRAMQSGFSSFDYALYENEDFRSQTINNWCDTAREIAAGEPLKALSYITNHYSLLMKCLRQGEAKVKPNDLLSDDEDLSDKQR